MTSVYDLSRASQPLRIEPSAFCSTWRTDGIPRWVRMTSPPPDEWASALTALEVPAEVVAALEEAGAQPMVVARASVVAVTMPVLVPASGETEFLRSICLPGLLITIDPVGLPALDHVAAEHCEAVQGGATPARLFIEVLDVALRSAGKVYLSLRGDLDALDHAVEDQALDVPTEQILEMKRRVAALTMLWEDQAYCLLELQRRLAHHAEFGNVLEPLRDLVSAADRGLKVLGRWEVRLRDLRAHHQHSLQEQTNRRLNVLAILSSIYLPATLIAGIYGMNFEQIPITQVRYGYVIVLSLMAVVVFGQFWYFSRRGWFR